MKVAVLMSTYNGEKYIREQIDSILNQVGAFELDLWVRDDGSKDATREILKEYAEKGKLNWYTGENLKPAHSFLDLIRHCQGFDYYALADQDDYWMPDKVKKGVEKLESNKSQFKLYFSNAELVDCELKSLGRGVYKSTPRLDFETLICAGGLLGCTMIFNSGLAELIQKKEIPIKMVLHDFYISAVCSAVCGKIIYDSTPHIKYRQHENNVVGVASGKFKTLKNRINDIMQKSKISISEQAEAIGRIYSNEINDKNKDWLYQVANYRKSFFTRVVMACTHKVKYMNKNMALKLRLSILLGNR